MYILTQICEISSVQESYRISLSTKKNLRMKKIEMEYCYIYQSLILTHISNADCILVLNGTSIFFRGHDGQNKVFTTSISIPI